MSTYIHAQAMEVGVKIPETIYAMLFSFKFESSVLKCCCVK